MRVYVAGPMTGYDEWNFPAFADATEDLREAGYEVTSPHEIDLEGGFDPSGKGEGFDLLAALERDVEEVLAADGVALLDGWEESPGAVIEVLTAASQGKPARRVKEWLAGLVAAIALLLGVGVSPAVGMGDEGGRIAAAHRLRVQEDHVEKRLDEVREDGSGAEQKREEVRLQARLRVIRKDLREV